MKKEQSVLSDTSVPDPLKIFAKKHEHRVSNHSERSKVTAQELLTALMPTHNQFGCLPLISSLEKCNKTNDKAKNILEDYNGSDTDKKVDETLKKVFSDIDERIDEEEEEEKGEYSETQCSTSVTDELKLSFDGKWLRKCFKLPLKMAIKEIVSRKPCDPVGYLGFWLLNYRRCQERRRWQLEKDNELNYFRSLIEQPMSKGEEVSVDYGEEEEEEMHDLNFKYYHTVHK
ncbi:hypothetical protein ANTQUA_LOCUS9157 [Anthophora quadrimaculata]